MGEKKKKKAFDVEALWKIDRVGSVSLSPDAAQAVCAVTTYSMSENKAAASLFLLSCLGGEPRRLTTCGEKDGQPPGRRRATRSPSSPGASRKAARTRRRSST